MAKSRIDLELNYSVSESGLQKAQTILQQIVNKAAEAGTSMGKSLGTGAQKANDGLQQAAKTAQKLDTILDESFNSDLGTLNVTKFNQKLKESGLTLAGVKRDLEGAGNRGAAAFAGISNAILGTNIQLKKSNAMLDEMAKTMANTVRWGITSSIFNTITDSISKAVSYTKNLDKSLNDIRIVSGASADQMARFAEEANTAAKQLGASTLDYTNAALIYYQQGLSESAAAERTDITVKMANVLGESTGQVSSYMTAIWNNFDNGSKSLEHYADVITALGAATASSAAEISTGLEKFASVAEASGLSYEYATSALATVVSETRQSADTVGTAFKTIFARIQGLSLGETLDDGTNLNKYSQALASVGISIKDDNGQLKEMDTILEEMGSKWKLLGQDQKLALAQTVAGVRQYNQLVALLDNYDKFNNNLETALDSTGALNEQQDIFLDSTISKTEKLRATWEDLYSTLIAPDEMNGLIDVITNLVQSVADFSDAFGGGAKSLLAFGAIATSVFDKQIVRGINNVIGNNRVLQENLAKTNLMAQAAHMGVNDTEGKNFANDTEATESAKVRADNTKMILEAQNGFADDAELQQAFDLSTKAGEAAGKAKKFEQKTNTQIQAANFSDDSIKESVEAGKTEEAKFEIDSKIEDLEYEKALIKEILELEKSITEEDQEQYNLAKKEIDEAETKIKNTQKRLDALNNKGKNRKDGHLNSKDKSEYVRLQASLATRKQEKENAVNKRGKIGKIEDKRAIVEARGGKVSQDQIKANEALVKSYKKQRAAVKEIAQAQEVATEESKKHLKYQQELQAKLDQAKQYQKIQNAIQGVTGALTSYAMVYGTISSLGELWKNEEVATGDKLAQTIMTLSMTVPMLAANFSKMTTALGGTLNVMGFLNVATSRSISLSDQEKAAAVARSVARAQTIAGISAETAASSGLDEALEKLIKEETTELTIESLDQTLKSKGIVLDQKKLQAIYAETAATKIKNGAMKSGLAISEMLNASMLANPVTAVLAAVAVLATALLVLNKAQKEHEKRLEEARQKRVEDNKEKLQEIGANQELLKSYEELNKAYKQGEASKDDLLKKGLEVAEALGIEDAQVLALIGDYDTLNAKIQGKKHGLYYQEFQTSSQLYTDESNAPTIDEAEDKLREALPSYFDTNIDPDSVWGTLVENAKESGLYSTARVNTNDDTDATVSLDTKGKIDVSGDPVRTVELLEKTLKDLEEKGVSKDDPQYKELSKALTQFTNAIDIQYLKGLRQDSGVAQMKTALTNENNSEEKIIGKEVENLSDFNEYRQAFINTAAEDKTSVLYGDKEVTQQAVDAALAENPEYQNLLQQLTIADAVAEKIGTTNGTAAYEEILAKVENLTEEQMKYIGAIGDITSIDQLEEAIANARLLAREAAVQDTIKSSSQIIDTLAEGKALSEEQSKELDKLESEYQELGNIRDRSSQEYLEKLKEIRQALEEENIATQELQANQAIEEGLTIDIVANPDQFQEAMDEILDAQHEVVVAIKADVQSDFDETANYLTDINSLMSKIGENFEVAPDQLEELNDVFPGILDGFSMLDNGQVQLSKDSVKLATTAAKANIEASKQETIAKLNDQLMQVTARKDTTFQLLQMAKAGLDTEAKAQEFRDKLKLLESENNDILADNEAKRVENEVTNNINAAETIVQTWAEARQQMANYAVQQAQISRDALAASINPATQMPTVQGFDANFKTTASFTPVEEEDTEEKIKTLQGNDKNAQQKIIEGLESEFKFLAETENNILGKIIETEARAEQQMKVLDNVEIGAGANAKSGKDKKKVDDEKNELKTYRDIERVLDKVANKLDIVEEKESHLYGKELINSLKEKNKLLKEQARGYEGMDKVIDQEAALKGGELASFGITFDGEAEITNYADIYIQELNRVNAAIHEFEASAQTEKDQVALDQAQERFERFEELIDLYDDTMDKRADNQLKKLENEYAIIGNNFKAWETEIQVTLDLDAAKREWTEFLREMSKDIQTTARDFGAEIAENVQDFNNIKNTDYTTNLKAVTDIMAEMDKLATTGKSDKFASMSEAKEALKEYGDSLRESSELMYQEYQEAWNKYLENVDDVISKWDDVFDKFSEINEELDHYASMIEMLYGDSDEGLALTQQLLETQQNAQLKEMESLRIQRETLEKERQELLDAGADENDEDIKKIDETLKQNASAMRGAIETYTKTSIEAFKNSNEQVMRQFDKNMTGGLGMSKVSEDWEIQKKSTEGEYDSVERLYELEKMQNRVNKAINSASTLKSQQKLKEIGDAINKSLEERATLTEYDVTLAEKQLAIAQAEMELEDAKNNKNAMKLIRGSDGNWSYQYIADAEAVEDKEQNLLDKTQDYYDFVKTSGQETMEKIISLSEEYNQKMLELANDVTLSEAEKAARREELYAQYWGDEGIITKLSQRFNDQEKDMRGATTIALKTLYDADEGNFKLMTTHEQELITTMNENNISSFDALHTYVAGAENGTLGGVLGDIDSKVGTVMSNTNTAFSSTAGDIIKDWVTDEGSVKKNLSDMFSGLESNQKTFDESVKTGTEASGINYTNFGEQIEGVNGKIGDTADEIEDVVDETDDLSDQREVVEELETAWAAVFSELEACYEKLTEYIETYESWQPEDKSSTHTVYEKRVIQQTVEDYGDGNTGDGMGDQKIPKGNPDPKAATTKQDLTMNSGEEQAYYNWARSKDSSNINTYPIPSKLFLTSGKVVPELEKKKQQLQSGQPVNYVSDKVRQYIWDNGFDTGGYTGDWEGNEGRLAVLHSKEIVLNKQDTANILEAVSAVRDLSSISSSITNSIYDGIRNMMQNALGQFSANYSANTINNTSNSNDNSTTNNSNVDNHFNINMQVDGGNVDEIKEAILSLPTLASQYLSQA